MSCGAVKAGSSNNSQANLIKKDKNIRAKRQQQQQFTTKQKTAISIFFTTQRSLFLTTYLMIFFRFFRFLPYIHTKLKIHEKNTAQNIKIFDSVFLEEIIIKYEILFGVHNGFSPQEEAMKYTHSRNSFSFLYFRRAKKILISHYIVYIVCESYFSIQLYLLLYVFIFIFMIFP